MLIAGWVLNSRIVKRAAVVLATAWLVAGCSTTDKAWVYTPNPPSSTAPLSGKTAVVLPFEDGRQRLNDDHSQMFLIPLCPFGWQDLNTPEGVETHLTTSKWTDYKPTEDFAKALAVELENARLYDQTHFDSEGGNADIIIRGKILSTYYAMKVFSYCISAYGPMFWFVGLPEGTFTNKLSVQLSCVSARTNQVLFSKTYDVAPDEKTSWIYTLPNDFNYPEMLKQVNEQFIADLRMQPAAL
jgi:hypothetical protein